MATWRLHFYPVVIGLMTGLSGCASTPMPDVEMARATASVEQARRSGAGEAAPMALKSAEDHLREARKAVDEEKADRARALAEKAELDAELAQARLQRQQAEQAAAEVQRATESLRRESERAIDSAPSTSTTDPAPGTGPAREAP